MSAGPRDGARALAGEIKGFTGVDDPYEPRERGSRHPTAASSSIGSSEDTRSSGSRSVRATYHALRSTSGLRATSSSSGTADIRPSGFMTPRDYLRVVRERRLEATRFCSRSTTLPSGSSSPSIQPRCAMRVRAKRSSTRSFARTTVARSPLLTGTSGRHRSGARCGTVSSAPCGCESVLVPVA